MKVTTDLAAAVEQALQAPSVHNTQPWRWRIRTDAVELHADRNRHLAATDPDGRDLVLSCGAALHHLQVALAAQGVAVDVTRLPDPDDTQHLATVTVRPGPADTAAAALLPALRRRRTERRRMSHRPVAPAQVRTLVDEALRAGAVLLPVTSTAMRRRLTLTVAEAARRQEFTPGYTAELQMWTHRYSAADDGVPLSNIAPMPAGLPDASLLRRFPHPMLRQPRQYPGHGPADDAAELLVVTTEQDDVLDRLRAGEATSAVLLTATRLGLATTPLSQVLEIESSRRELRDAVLHATGHPQLLIRVGWPATNAAELPATPRRDLHSVLLPS